MPHVYEHTQRATLTRALLLVAAAVAVTPAVASSGAAWGGYVALGIIAVISVLFTSLTTRVGDGFVEVRFGPGPIRRRIALSEIASADEGRNRWYWGWGIRLTPQGWMWNVHGLSAVQLELADGRRFRIGTDDPERLSAVIRGEIAR